MKNIDFKILIVDDIKSNLHVLGKILSKEGYRVSATDSGQNTLNYLSKNSVDLILLDIMMPEMDGYEVCKRLKKDENLKGIPVIFVTAKVDENDIYKGFEAGGEDYITKPIKNLEVVMRVKNSLEKSYALKRLEKENKLKTELMSILSHDLRTPISNIVSTIDFYNNNVLTEEETINFLTKLGVSARATSRVLNDVLLWINSQQSSISVNLSEFKVSDIISEIHNTQQKALDEKNIKFVFEDNYNRKIKSDKNLLHIIIRNFISNAIKFTLENGTISTYVSQDNNYTTIIVENSGKGISPENIDKILDPTSNFTTFGTKKEKGTGLGLNICVNFIKLLKGTFTIESEIDKMTKMIIKIPNKFEKI